MALDYTPSSRLRSDATGSLVTCDYWLSKVEFDLPAYNLWYQYLGKSGQNIYPSSGGARYFQIPIANDLTLSGTTPLGAGTAIPGEDSTGLSVVSGTLNEYGKHERIENFADWISNVDLYSMSYESIARNAFRTRNALVGAAFLATTNYFVCNGTGTASKGTYTGTRGTDFVNPTHVRQIKNELARMGIEPFDDGMYRWVYAPGQLDYLKSQSEVYSSAANLGKTDVYDSGEEFRYGGFVFVREDGASAKTTYSATVGTSVVFGKNAVYGWDTFMDSNLIWVYSDDQNDNGRTGKIQWSAKAGYVRPVDGTANGRIWLVYSKGGE